MKRGLTRVEVMVLLVLAVIVVALILPILATARNSASRAGCANTLNAIGKAFFMYADVPSNNNLFPTQGPTGKPFDDTAPMLALSLLYKGYIADARVFQCPSDPRPKTATDLTDSTGQRIQPGGNYLSAASCSYGYDPGRSNKDDDATSAIAADRKGTGKNSDNHGSDAGQNVLFAGGAVEFREAPQVGSDPNIYSLNPELPRKDDSYIRQ